MKGQKTTFVISLSEHCTCRNTVAQIKIGLFLGKIKKFLFTNVFPHYQTSTSIYVPVTHYTGYIYTLC